MTHLVREAIPELAQPVQLPPVHRFDAHFTALEDQTLPPLPTTALRGALLRSLKELTCREPARLACEGCPHLARCAYPALVEPRDAQGHEQPSPFTMRPAFPVQADENQPLRRGEDLHVEFAFLGDVGLEHVGLVRAALSRVANKGIGLKHAGERPALEFEHLTRVPVGPVELVRRYDVELATPLRLTIDGASASTLDANSLWAGVVRRVRQLCALYGEGAPTLPFEVPWRITESELARISIGRYSDRQKQRMRWPGLVGRLRLEVTDHHALSATLLRFISEVQLGKGTQFGCGVVRCESSFFQGGTP